MFKENVIKYGKKNYASFMWSFQKKEKYQTNSVISNRNGFK